MTTALLLHGAGSTGWYWHRVTPLLESAGLTVVAPDLPADNPDATLTVYVDVAVAAVSDRGGDPVVVVAQSMAGLIAPVIATRRPVAAMILVAAMIPAPGETGHDWWAATGHAGAQRQYLASLGLGGADPFDPEVVFIHDLTADLTAESLHHVRNQSMTPFDAPSPIEAWPGVPTFVIGARGDRFFPVEFMRRQARERLGLDVDVVPGGHLVALSQPDALAERLLSYAALTSPPIGVESRDLARNWDQVADEYRSA